MIDALGVYVHLPFCPYICPYCDFAKFPHRASRAKRYLTALDREIERMGNVPAATIFFGGGTPNAYDAPSLSALTRRVSQAFPAIGSDEREISVEVNPELVRDGDFSAYRAAGVTRISIGVQSFVPAEITTMGRRHTPEDPSRVVHSARAAGMQNVSMDLIFAIPGQTLESWLHSVDAAIALGVDHISCYGLTVEEGTPFERWERREPAAFPDDDAQAELYGATMDRLEAAGFEHYEISNFARPGKRCAHNENYWRNGDYIGLGVGAASYRDGVRYVNTRDFDAYCAALEEDARIPVQSERLEGAKRVGEAIMLALRTEQGVETDDFQNRYGIQFEEEYGPVITRLLDNGLLQRTATQFRLTRRGRMLANSVCAEFLG